MWALCESGAIADDETPGSRIGTRRNNDRSTIKRQGGKIQAAKRKQKPEEETNSLSPERNAATKVEGWKRGFHDVVNMGIWRK